MNPIRPGLLENIKSWRGGQGTGNHTFEKLSSDCQNALKFGLSNVWDVSFLFKIALTHTLHKYA